MAIAGIFIVKRKIYKYNNSINLLKNMLSFSKLISKKLLNNKFISQLEIYLQMLLSEALQAQNSNKNRTDYYVKVYCLRPDIFEKKQGQYFT